MGKIYCIMGMSSTGKDTLFHHVSEHFKTRLKPIVTYTTRPKRKAERDGQTYHFVKPEVLDAFIAQGKMVEQRIYQTVQGPWRYATVDDGSIDLHAENYLCIITLEAYKAYQVYFGSENLVPLYINVDETERIKRAKERERHQSSPDYAELERRMVADRADFSPENLASAGIDTPYQNDILLDCVHHLVADIERDMERKPTP